MPVYLAALPCFPGSRGFCHRTILVSAKDFDDALSRIRHHRPGDNIGDIEVFEDGWPSASAQPGPLYRIRWHNGWKRYSIDSDGTERWHEKK